MQPTLSPVQPRTTPTPALPSDPMQGVCVCGKRAGGLVHIAPSSVAADKAAAPARPAARCVRQAARVAPPLPPAAPPLLCPTPPTPPPLAGHLPRVAGAGGLLGRHHRHGLCLRPAGGLLRRQPRGTRVPGVRRVRGPQRRAAAPGVPPPAAQAPGARQAGRARAASAPSDGLERGALAAWRRHARRGAFCEWSHGCARRPPAPVAPAESWLQSAPGAALR